MTQLAIPFFPCKSPALLFKFNSCSCLNFKSSSSFLLLLFCYFDHRGYHIIKFEDTSTSALHNVAIHLSREFKSIGRFKGDEVDI